MCVRADSTLSLHLRDFCVAINESFKAGDNGMKLQLRHTDLYSLYSLQHVLGHVALGGPDPTAAGTVCGSSGLGGVWCRVSTRSVPLTSVAAR